MFRSLYMTYNRSEILIPMETHKYNSRGISNVGDLQFDAETRTLFAAGIPGYAMIQLGSKMLPKETMYDCLC